MFLISLSKDSRKFLAFIILPYYFIWSFYMAMMQELRFNTPICCLVLAESVFVIDNHIIKKITKV